ncbi:MAG: DUF4389 domain-containing protein [Actinobacteria bacterium]|nr:DUF4389 domain-containing protein [Actinomycetota bacterium]
MPDQLPIRVVVEDDLRRSRLTVAFRLILAIPHILWFFIWSLGAFILAIVAWVIGIVRGRLPDGLHDFFASYVRYSTHFFAYVLLAANPYPGFTGRQGSYPLDVEIAGPEPQRRLTIAFRLFLAIPAIIIASTLLSTPFAGGGGSGQNDEWGGGEYAFLGGGGVAFLVGFLAWFSCLARARMPRGFRDLLTYALRYNAQMTAYLFFVTARYPDSDPAEPRAAGDEGIPPQAVRMTVDDDGRRSRVTVFFRLFLTFPHLVWLTLWGVAALLAALANWVATLVSGRPPRVLHRFLSAYVRYTVHVAAFLFLVANPFPGFTGAPGYPVDVEIDPPEPQPRLASAFRLLLALPALLLGGTLLGLLFVVGMLGWFASLATGRMPEGLRNAGAFTLRYGAQVDAYGLYLLTARYPYSGPSRPAEPAAEPYDEPGAPLAATA